MTPDWKDLCNELTLYEAWALRWRWVYHRGSISRLKLSQRPGMMQVGGKLAPMGDACLTIRSKWVQQIRSRITAEEALRTGLTFEV